MGRKRMHPEAGVYRITCVPTGQFYIGATVNLAARKSIHMGAIKRRTHRFQRLKRLAERFEPDQFKWETIQAIDLSPSIVDNLEAAEHSHLNEAARSHPDLLLNNPNAVYHRGCKSRNQTTVLREFKRFCLEKGLNFTKGLDLAFSAFMSSFETFEKGKR